RTAGDEAARQDRHRRQDGRPCRLRPVLRHPEPAEDDRRPRLRDGVPRRLRPHHGATADRARLHDRRSERHPVIRRALLILTAVAALTAAACTTAPAASTTHAARALVTPAPTKLAVI